MPRLLLAVLACLLLPATADAFVWTPAVPLTDPAVGFAQDARVTVTSSGEVVAAIVDRKAGDAVDLRVESWWLGAGGAASPLTELGATGGNTMDLGSDGLGNAYLAWSDAAGRVRLARKPAGAGWEEPQIVEAASGNVALDVNPRGDVALAWQRFIPGTPESPNGGAAWEAVVVPRGGSIPATATVLAPRAPYAPGMIDVAIGDDGDLVALRTGDPDDPARPSFAETVVVEPGLAPVLQRLHETSGPLTCPRIAAGPGGAAIATWHEAINCEWWGPDHVALRAPAAPFAPATVAPAGSDATTAHVSVDDTGRAILAFNSSNGLSGTGTILTARGVAWTSAVTIPGWVMDLDGSYIAWEGGTGAVGTGAMTARVAADGTLEQVQDVAPECTFGVRDFAVAIDGRGGLLLQRDQSYSLARQADGDPPPARCAPVPDPPAAAPPPAEPSSPPAAAPRTSVSFSARLAPRRTLVLRAVRSPGGPVGFKATIRVPGRRAIRREATNPDGSAVARIRLAKRAWRSLKRKRLRVTAKLAYFEDGRLQTPTVRRSVRR